MAQAFKDWVSGMTPATPNDTDRLWFWDQSGDVSSCMTWAGLYSSAVSAATAADLSIVDSGALYTATDVEGALQEIATTVDNLSTAAADITITDTGAYYTATNVEDALAEVKVIADAALPTVWDQPQAVNAQTGTTYTPVAADMGKLVTLNNSSAITLTIPQDSDLGAWSIGVTIEFLQLGTGQVTVAAGTGSTIRTSGLTNKARSQYSRFAVQKIAANTFNLFGDLAAS